MNQNKQTSKKPLDLIVLARDQREPIRDAWLHVEKFLKQQTNVNIVAKAITEDLKEAPQADIALVLGGDGAILRACRQFAMKQIPILGINLGRLGFLAEVTIKEFEQAFSDIQKRKYQVISHLMFQCTVRSKNRETETHLGLNEVAVVAGGSLGMFDVELAIDGENVTTYAGDGVIISTPVGSTAHSLSAGGPLLRQDIYAFVVTPICPHTLTIRPIVDRADCLYQLTVPDAPKGVTAVIDGQIRIPLEPGDIVEVRKAPVEFQLARLPTHSYYNTLHRKLGWHGQPSYRRQKIK